MRIIILNQISRPYDFNLENLITPTCFVMMASERWTTSAHHYHSFWPHDSSHSTLYPSLTNKFGHLTAMAAYCNFLFTLVIPLHFSCNAFHLRSSTNLTMTTPKSPDSGRISSLSISFNKIQIISRINLHFYSVINS